MLSLGGVREVDKQQSRRAGYMEQSVVGNLSRRVWSYSMLWGWLRYAFDFALSVSHNLTVAMRFARLYTKLARSSILFLGGRHDWTQSHVLSLTLCGCLRLFLGKL